MSQEVGDAVLRFLGDSTQLDAKFDQVGPNAERAFAPAAKAAEGLGAAMEDTGKKAESAADDIEDAGTRAKFSMREARGEVRLLGEEFGIHLPRHVSNFVAELPGVGQAMSAAFSATAILFLVQALVQATEKLSSFIGSTLIFTSAMREQTAEIIRQNIQIAQQSDLYRSAAKELENLNDHRTPLQKLTDQLKSLNDEYDNLVHEREPEAVLQAKARRITEEIKLLEKEIELQKEADEKGADKKALAALKEHIALQRDLTLALVAYRQAENQGNDKSNYDEARFQIKLIALEKEKAAEEKYNKDNLAGIEKLNNEIKILMVERGTQVQEELNKERATLNKTLEQMQADVKATSENIEIVPPQAVQKLLTFINTAHQLGIVLKQDLAQGVKDAQKALDQFGQSGIADSAQFKVLVDNLHKAQKALHDFGQDEERFKARTESTWKNFQYELKNGANAMVNLSQMGKETFDSMAIGVQGAIQQVILAQGSLGQALEKATAQALASLASQALVKALFYGAEGLASLAMFNYGSAGQYFAAAGEMAAVGAAAGLTARAMSGGGEGGGRGSNAQGHDSVSNTGQSNRSGGSSFAVQAFAEGGLVTGPTIALAGEAGREAVLPLSDQRAMAEIGAAIGKHGGGTTHHWHIDGMISADHLSKVVKQISKMVDKGQVHLTASNSLRLTKRSA